MKKCIMCGETFVKGGHISFHLYANCRFPKNKHVRSMWFKRCDLDEWDITNHSTLCSKHFSPDDFDSCKDYRTRLLKKTAIPSIGLPVSSKRAKRSIEFCNVPSTSAKNFQHFDEDCSGGAVLLEHSFAAEPKLDPLETINVYLPIKSVSPEPEIKPLEKLNPPEKSMTSEPVVEMQSTDVLSPCKNVYQFPRYPGDMTIHHFDTPSKAARNLEWMQKELTRLRVKVKNLQTISRAKTKRIENFKTLLLEFREKDLISENVCKKLMPKLFCKSGKNCAPSTS